MYKLYDKAVLAVMAALYIGGSRGTAEMAALLFSLSVSMISQSAENERVPSALLTGYTVLCWFAPVLCLGLPFAVYEIADKKRTPLMIACAPPVIGMITGYGIGGCVFCLLGSAAAVVLQRRTAELIVTRHKLIETRDNSKELNSLLEERNRRLIETQDIAIYAATLKERNRIAREIHDNVGHMLTRSILQVGAMTAVAADEDQKEGLRSVQATLNSTMTSIRQSVHDLHDDSIDLERTVRDISRSAGDRIEVTVNYDCSPDMPNNVKYAFIAIVREALTNAEKYSNGDKALVSVLEFPAFYRLTVRDNGENPVREEIDCRDRSAGIGLTNMYERTKALGGIIRISSSEKEYKIFVSIPKK